MQAASEREERALAELRQLKKLLDDKVITQREFEEKRKPLLRELVAGNELAQRDDPPAPPWNVSNEPDKFVYNKTDGSELLSGAEKAVRHEYCPLAKKWTRTAFLCKIEDRPFAEGAMRVAHRLYDLATTGVDACFVVKISKSKEDSAQQYFNDVQMQMEARVWAQRYNECFPPKAVDFIAAYVLELVDRPQQPICGVERFIAGTYRKWNNNWNWSDDERNTPQAFSHFTWEASGHQLLICDIQGVGDLWTDPQIHTAEGGGFGRGNLGPVGIAKFLSAHRCNAICKYLQLPPTGAPGASGGGGGGGGAQGRRTRAPPTRPAHGLVGVGLALAARDGVGLVVTQVVAQGAAFKDGRVMAGDRLRAVDGRPVGRGAGALEDVKGLILGPPGTTVRLGLTRNQTAYDVTGN